MDIAIYMSVIPGIIYGMALVELIRIYRHKSQYWETNLIGVFLFVTIISDRYKTFPYIDQLFENMFVFTIYMIAPLVFMQACYTLTPELEEDVALEHFKNRRKSFFLLMAGFTSINVVIEIFLIDQNLLYMRIAVVLLFIFNAIFDKLWLRAITYALIIYGIGKIFWPSISMLF
jgi:hypothetical protein